MKKFCALRFNSSSLGTSVLGFGDYSDCEKIILSDDFYKELNYHHFILQTDNKVSQGYIQNALINIINNVAMCLKMMDRFSLSRPSQYLDLKDTLNNKLLSNVDSLISHSLI